MSARVLDHEELRNAEINRLTLKIFNTFCAAILTGAASASGLANLVLDKLAEPGAIETLARTVLSCDAMASGQLLRKLIIDVLQAEAEADATKQVDGHLRE